MTAAVQVVRMGGFLAYVFRADQVWVSVRPEGNDMSWSGCWSGEPPSTAALQDLLGRLASDVARHSQVGPFGLHLSEHLFYEGWESWGSGVPAPIAHLMPDSDVMRAAVPTAIEQVVLDGAGASRWGT